MASKPKFGFALEYVTDIEAAKRFYVDVLGLEVERAAPVFVQFTDHFAIASDESMAGANLELYWIVDDADAAFKALPKGTEISLPVTQKPFGKVFGVKDPAGEPRYLIEFSANRSSKPVS
jgi:catechol 2,3-dioxygenase-like lactoylglutathione lyase family enzyme